MVNRAVFMCKNRFGEFGERKAQKLGSFGDENFVQGSFWGTVIFQDKNQADFFGLATALIYRHFCGFRRVFSPKHDVFGHFYSYEAVKIHRKFSRDSFPLKGHFRDK